MKKKTYTKDEMTLNDFKNFINKTYKGVYADKYTLDETTWVNKDTPMMIHCKNHGWFERIPSEFAQGFVCPYESNAMRNNIEWQKRAFLEKAKMKFDNRFNYNIDDYIDCKHAITIVCKKHGSFKDTPDHHLCRKDGGCTECHKESMHDYFVKEGNMERNLMATQEFINRADVISKPEKEIKKYILSLSPNEEIIQGSYKILGKKEIDLYFPNKNVAIEFNGIHWHTEEFGRDKHYHLDKLNQCNEKGISLIHIFEDEWTEHKDIVLSKISHALHINNYTKKIRGHKCLIKEISPVLAKPFFNDNHIQGYIGGSIILGAFFENELVGACIFKKEVTEGHYELTRMATKNNYLCHGICGKLFKWFIISYKPIQIKSFADRRWTLHCNNNLYTSLGFKLKETLKPDYRYVIGNKRIHKFNCRKNTLHKKYGLPLTMTELEMTKQLGYYRIWDCGLYKYVWNQEL